MATTAPVLSTASEHLFEPSAAVNSALHISRLSEAELFVQYEIQRTIREIRNGRWKRIALQFPDEMLVDAPRVFERLRDGLRRERKAEHRAVPVDGGATQPAVSEQLEKLDLNKATLEENVEDAAKIEEKLCILGDTSYGACCVDEIAAEHIEAEVVVHYGRACLSPTARLPVIYVFTSKQVDLGAVVRRFEQLYPQKEEKVCLVADMPYSQHIPQLHASLLDHGYHNIFATEIIREPSSLLPNRTIPLEVKDSADKLKDYSIFHISDPPTSLLLVLSSRVKRIDIFPTTTTTRENSTSTSTSLLLRRRYALVTRLSTTPIFGILINTLSVANYLSALTHCQNLISRAGKKSYVFVVGKVNAAKLANFSEIGGWVVIGCWESSLLESRDFYAPVITPFELEVALKDDGERVWGGEWVADFAALLETEESDGVAGGREGDLAVDGIQRSGDLNEGDELSDDEPPDFDLRTGRYVSRSSGMGQRRRRHPAQNGGTAPPSSALVQRAKGDLATINGAVSPAAEFLRSKRTWTGLGSDYEIAYERGEDGEIRGAAVEEGRSGVAKGYKVGLVGSEG